MAIDHDKRSTGIGASEVAAIVGLSPYQTPFDLYVRKLRLVDDPPATSVQRRGKYFERGVIDWYSDLTGHKTEWFDEMVFHPDRPWQFSSPDAWIIEDEKRVAEAQAKTVNWRNVDEYGEPGTDAVPPHCLVQSQWTMSTANTQYGDLAALLGMDELAVYRIHRDPEIEAALLEAADQFWRHHVLARVPPPITGGEVAAAYLKKRFPLNIEPLRVATNEERLMLVAVRHTDEEFELVKARKESLDNALRLAIGNAEGILHGAAKITYRMSQPSVGPDWKAMAEDAIRGLAEWEAEARSKCEVPTGEIQREFRSLLLEFTAKHTRILQAGSRRLHKNWNAAGKIRRRKST